MEDNWQDRLRADTSDRARELVRLLDLTKSRDDLPEVARALGDVKQKRGKTKKGPAELRQDGFHSLQRKAAALLTQALPGPAAAHSESNRARQPVERDPREPHAMDVDAAGLSESNRACQSADRGSQEPDATASSDSSRAPESAVGGGPRVPDGDGMMDEDTHEAARVPAAHPAVLPSDSGRASQSAVDGDPEVPDGNGTMDADTVFLYPSMVPATAAVMSPGEHQGRGLKHAHGYGYMKPEYM